MNEQQQQAAAHQQQQALIREIITLLYQVARRPGSIKLLLGIRDYCKSFSQYKANRRR